MPMRHLAVAALVLAALLAGCGSGSDRPPTPGGQECTLEPALCDPQAYLGDHHCLRNDVRPRVYAPDTPGPDTQPSPWRQGDWWSYRLSIGGQERDTTLVYYDDADMLAGKAQHYLVGTPTRQEALEHALFSTNPVIGRIHRSLYSPHESGAHADMFNFPLCEGNRWQTTFYGRQFSMVARPQAVELPGGGRDASGFSIHGDAPDGSRLDIRYSPQVKWFTSLRVERPGEPLVTMDLTGHGSGKSGRHEFLRAQRDEVVRLAEVPPGLQGRTISRADGGEGPYDSLGVYLQVQRTTGSGKVEVHLRDPSGTSRACVGVAGDGVTGQTSCPSGPLLAEVPYAAGDWRVTVERSVIDSRTAVQGELRLVSIYDRGGTV